jgi:NAD(P)-dependent dehydrogenase (short-subunit alcohol dehydrogenase family)
VLRVPFGELDALDEMSWDHIFAVNLKGTFLCTRAAVRAMRAVGGGAVVNIGSIGGLRPHSSNLAYACSKAAIVHLSECLAVSLAPVIRVNCIAPGVTVTRRLRPGQPPVGVLQRHVEAADVAAAVVECVRNDSLTGVTLPVDAGAVLV